MRISKRTQLQTEMRVEGHKRMGGKDWKNEEDEERGGEGEEEEGGIHFHE